MAYASKSAVPSKALMDICLTLSVRTDLIGSEME